MEIRKSVGKVIYRLIAIHMPLSTARINFGSRQLRNFCARLILDNCGKQVNIEKGAQFCDDLIIGNGSAVGVNCLLSSGIAIGENVMMGPECMMFSTNHNISSTRFPMCKQGFASQKRITIGNDVWIGARVIILPGVTVGDGSVIGAGSVVTHDVEPYTVVAGNPAKIIRRRK